MAAMYSPITRTHGWYRNERKKFRFPVVDESGNPKSLSLLALQWRLLRHAGSDHVYMTVDDFDIEGEDNEVAVFEVSEDSYEGVPARWYYHELWDRSTHTLLAQGGALLQRARAG